MAAGRGGLLVAVRRGPVLAGVTTAVPGSSAGGASCSTVAGAAAARAAAAATATAGRGPIGIGAGSRLAAVAGRGLGDRLRRTDGAGPLDGRLDARAPRSALLGLGHDARLDLLRALGRAARPIAQALELARLGEVEHCQHGQAEERGEPDVGAVLLDLVLDREREEQTMEPSRRF